MSDPDVLVLRDRLAELVELDRLMRLGGVATEFRPHAVGDQGGLFLYLIALLSRPRRILEVGTSFGYSTVWLAAAARELGATVVSWEVDAGRSAKAAEVLELYGFSDIVELRVGDARTMREDEPPGLVFLDAEKAEYSAYLLAVRRLLPQGERCVVLVDNMISHRGTVAGFVHELDDAHIPHQLVPIGKGIELCVIEGS